MKINLVTVTGSRTDTLKHWLEHYKGLVDEIWIGVYEWDGVTTYDEIKKICKGYKGINIFRFGPFPKYDWNKVTEIYNTITNSKPNEWWVVADDDEFHKYSLELNKIVLLFCKAISAISFRGKSLSCLLISILISLITLSELLNKMT